MIPVICLLHVTLIVGATDTSPKYGTNSEENFTGQCESSHIANDRHIFGG